MSEDWRIFIGALAIVVALRFAYWLGGNGNE